MGARKLDQVAEDLAIDLEAPVSREAASTLARIRAVTASPTLYRLAAALEYERLVGRTPTNPLYVVLAYGVLARVLRSGIRVQVDLQDRATWLMVRASSSRASPTPGSTPRPRARGHPSGATGAGCATSVWPPTRAWPCWTGSSLPLAVDTAHRIGLLLPAGPGSFTHPDPSRVRLRRRHPRPADLPAPGSRSRSPTTTAPPASPTPTRAPRSCSTTRPAGSTPTCSCTTASSGPSRPTATSAGTPAAPSLYQRVVLAAAHIPVPGAEAATAVRAARPAYIAAAGDGIQVVVYDGALHGVHIDQIMTRYGYLRHRQAAHQLHRRRRPTRRRWCSTTAGRRTRSYPLGTIRHAPVGAVKVRAPDRRRSAARRRDRPGRDRATPSSWPSSVPRRPSNAPAAPTAATTSTSATASTAPLSRSPSGSARTPDSHRRPAPAPEPARDPRDRPGLRRPSAAYATTPRTSTPTSSAP